MDREVANFLYELGMLKRVQRSGWWLAGIRDPESVAEHCFRAAAIAYVLAEAEGADAGRAAVLALFHDRAEARVNDLHRLGKSYADWSAVEARASADQTRRLPEQLAASIDDLLGEARARTTLEARIAKDADSLECLLQAREYAAQGHAVDEWEKSSVAELSTAAAKRLAQAILATPPGEWRKRAGG